MSSMQEDQAKKSQELRGSLRDSLQKTRSSDPTNLTTKESHTAAKEQAAVKSNNKLYENIQKGFLRKSQELEL